MFRPTKLKANKRSNPMHRRASTNAPNVVHQYSKEIMQAQSKILYSQMDLSKKSSVDLIQIMPQPTQHAYKQKSQFQELLKDEPQTIQKQISTLTPMGIVENSDPQQQQQQSLPPVKTVNLNRQKTASGSVSLAKERDRLDYQKMENKTFENTQTWQTTRKSVQLKSVYQSKAEIHTGFQATKPVLKQVDQECVASDEDILSSQNILAERESMRGKIQLGNKQEEFISTIVTSMNESKQARRD